MVVSAGVVVAASVMRIEPETSAGEEREPSAISTWLLPVGGAIPQTGRLHRLLDAFVQFDLQHASVVPL
ncbi:MAG: hypothetical protein ACLSFT_07330 [Ruminococcus callidus]